MNIELLNQLRVYQSVSGYTKKALAKAIKELESSINDKANKSVKTHLIGRKEELEIALEKIENFEN
ncbi:MAG: hypothetical protein RBR93_09220 [Aliarcobacter butzleri]|uniref:hypothetical protein n=1 Tax=Aliarcobacter butzleri TaxID=28197 RepID=UPI00263F2A1B|nr:hypothetical protein [Aliarcobacter butzleri]MDN5092683.1 hypothetical protein [Aliarcobacter butzleri]MDY0193696.1 hypothetical protein [Aliarcobacter butzleri]